MVTGHGTDVDMPARHMRVAKKYVTLGTPYHRCAVLFAPLTRVTENDVYTLHFNPCIASNGTIFSPVPHTCHTLV